MVPGYGPRNVARSFQGRLGTYTHDGSQPPPSGQAEVLRCVGPGEMVVALKTPRDNVGAWLVEEQRAIEEIAARVADAHEWLIPVIDHGRGEDGRPFMVMPFFPWTLDRWIEAQKPALPDLAAACSRAAHAVARLHASSTVQVVLHRDLKPGNFLVRPGHHGVQVVLGDLGLAKATDVAVETRSTGTMTMGYAPVEQALPIRRALTRATDVHALGVTVFTALVGREPQGVIARRYTREGDALLNLHWVGVARLDADDRAEYDRLRELPLEALVDFSECAPLQDTDVRRLRTALQARLGADVPGDTLDRLVTLLTQAMWAHPDERLGDAGVVEDELRGFAEVITGLAASPRATFAPGALTPPVSGGPPPAHAVGSGTPTAPPRPVHAAGGGLGVVSTPSPARPPALPPRATGPRTGPPTPVTGGRSITPDGPRTDSPGTFVPAEAPSGPRGGVPSLVWVAGGGLAATAFAACLGAGWWVWSRPTATPDAADPTEALAGPVAEAAPPAAGPAEPVPAGTADLSTGSAPTPAAPAPTHRGSVPTASPAVAAPAVTPSSATPAVVEPEPAPADGPVAAPTPPAVPVTTTSSPTVTATPSADPADLPSVRVTAIFAADPDGERMGPGAGSVDDESPFTVGPDAVSITLRRAKDRTGSFKVSLQVVARGSGAALKVSPEGGTPTYVGVQSGSRVRLVCERTGCKGSSS